MSKTEIPDDCHHVILIAVAVDASATTEGRRDIARTEAMNRITRRIQTESEAPLAHVDDEGVEVTWWIAEDDRNDGSDCDSAVFVEYGAQTEALVRLHDEGLTPDCNLRGRVEI